MSSEPDLSKDIIVFYHANCADGFGAGWAAWKKFSDSASYAPISYSSPFSRTILNKTIFLLDFTHSEAEMHWLLENNRSVTVIDHHESKSEESKISTERIFDLNHSGAVLAWSYFHPDKSIPTLLRYVEDYDLWHHALPDTESIRKYITTIGFNDFKNWNALAMEIENERAMVIKEGNLIGRYEKNIYDQLESEAYRVMFEGYDAYAVNAPGWFADLLAQRLYRKHPPLAIVWRENRKVIHVSLRSDGSVNVANIAKKFAEGAGGHPGSAAFRLKPGTPLPWTRINE